MAKEKKLPSEYVISGTTDFSPLYTDWFREYPILEAYEKCQTVFEFEKLLRTKELEARKLQPEKIDKLHSFFKKAPSFVDRTKLIDKITSAYRQSGKDGFYATEETQLSRLRLFKKQVSVIADNEYEKKFELLEEQLGVKLSADQRDRLNKIASTLVMSRMVLDRPHTLSESKEACIRIKEPLEKTITALIQIVDQLDDKTKDRLTSISPEAGFHLLNIDGLHSITRACKKLLDKENNGHRRRKNPTLWTLIEGVATIYEEATGKQPTASKSGKHARYYSDFVLFCWKLIGLIFNIDNIYSLTVDRYTIGEVNKNAVKVLTLRKQKFKNQQEKKDYIKKILKK